MELTKVCVQGVAIPADARPVNESWVEQLQASMTQLGLLQPIAVTPDGRLVFGRHRLTAAERLDWEMIDAVLLRDDDLTLEMIRCDENLIRNDLTALERGEETAKKKRLYETLHPETVQGASGRGRDRVGESPTLSPRFTEAEAAHGGQEETAIRRDVQIGTDLKEPTKAILRGTEYADRKTDLLTLAQVEDVATQEAAAKLLVGGLAKSAQSAIAQATQQETAALFEAAGADSDPRIINARILKIWSRGVKQCSENILELEPETVARVLPQDRHAETRVFIGEITEWLEGLVTALDAPVHVIRGKAVSR